MRHASNLLIFWRLNRLSPPNFLNEQYKLLLYFYFGKNYRQLQMGTLGKGRGKRVAGHLKAARERAGLSGQAVGELLGGLSAAQISKMENCRQKIPADLFLNWCEVLGVSVSDFRSGNGSKDTVDAPFSSHVARLYGELPPIWQVHAQRQIEGLHRLYKKQSTRS